MNSPTPDPASVSELQLAQFAASLVPEDIPAAVLHEAKRSLVNIFATAIAGSREQAVDVVIKTFASFTGEPVAAFVGRPERGDEALAAFVNAMSANIFDFDDTHEATIIHPAATVFAAVFARAEAAALSGRRVLAAFVAGGEVECRIGNALSPYHYARGWHITSTCGVFGAAAGAGLLLGLDNRSMLHALGAAAAQSSGLVETLGTMAKSVSIGGAARNGLLSAHLAAHGLTGPKAPLTGERGYLRVYADEPREVELVDGLGSRWEIGTNTYKPYPVGVVVNPVIDACLALKQREGLSLDQVVRVQITGHPLLRQRTDRPEAAMGRESQVSAQHAIAITLLRGRAGLEEFSDEAAAETLRLGRPEVIFNDDPARDIASIAFVVRTCDGAIHELEVSAASGSHRNPLSDEQLEAKLRDGARFARFEGDVERLADAIWDIENLSDAGEIMRLASAART